LTIELEKNEYFKQFLPEQAGVWNFCALFLNFFMWSRVLYGRIARQKLPAFVDEFAGAIKSFAS
jgi:hypothetical protein